MRYALLRKIAGVQESRCPSDMFVGRGESIIVHDHRLEHYHKKRIPEPGLAYLADVPVRTRAAVAPFVRENDFAAKEALGEKPRLVWVVQVVEDLASKRREAAGDNGAGERQPRSKSSMHSHQKRQTNWKTPQIMRSSKSKTFPAGGTDFLHSTHPLTALCL